MTRLARLTLLVLFVLSVGPVWAQSAKQAKGKTDAEIAQEIIALSIASYSGSCPCPYNTDRGGRRCGGRSAYSRKGGASPLCYEGDVTAAMIKEHRQRTKK